MKRVDWIRGRSPAMEQLLQQYREHLTPRGRYLLWATAAFALIGVDTRRTQVFELFAVAFALLVIALLFAVLRRPKLSVRGRIPSRLTAGRALTLPLEVASLGGRGAQDVLVSWPRPRAEGAPDALPRQRHVMVEPDAPARLSLEVVPPRRGRFELRGIAAQVTDPVRLVAGRPVRTPPEAVLVYPRYFTVSQLEIPTGRRYQPGGIPLSSSTGDAIEFVGTREYREGDPIRSVHWRSWARRGEPVVKEYQEEYFCRLALVLDTSLPKKPSSDERDAFEAAISVLASIAEYFSRSEHVIDILAAGPDVYHVSAGRSLAYLDNILDVLACLEPSPDPPFSRIGPSLFDRLARLSTVVAVLQDWDRQREQFLMRVHALGTSVRAFVVRDGATTEPVPYDAAFGEVSVLTPSDVRAAIDSDGAMSFRTGRGGPGVVVA